MPTSFVLTFGTKLTNVYNSSNIVLFEKRSLGLVGFLLPCDIALLGFCPLREIPHCHLPHEFGPCFIPSVVDHLFKLATDRTLVSHCLTNS